MWKSLIDGRRIKKMFYVDEQGNLRRIKDMYSVTETGLKKWVKIPEIVFDDPIESPYCRYIGNGEQNEKQFWFSFVSEEGIMHSYSYQDNNQTYLILYTTMDYVYNNDGVYDLMDVFQNYGQPVYINANSENIVDVEFIDSDVKMFILNGVTQTIQPDARYYSQYDNSRLPSTYYYTEVEKIRILTNNEKSLFNQPDYTSHLIEFWLKETDSVWNFWESLEGTAAGNWNDYKTDVIMSLQGIRLTGKQHEVRYSNNIIINAKILNEYRCYLTGITLENPELGLFGSSWSLTVLGIQFEIWRYDSNDDSYALILTTSDGSLDFSDSNTQLLGHDCIWRLSQSVHSQIQRYDKIVVRKV